MKPSKEMRAVNRYMKTTSYPNRIVAHCIWCIYDSHAKGTFKSQIEACTSTNCPIHDIRMRALRGAD